MSTVIVEFPPSFASPAAALPAHGEMRREGAADDTLVRAIGAGDRSAMRVLFARHKNRVFRFILRMVRDRALADDLLNDVFLVVWQRATSFAGRSSVSTWLLGIARHKALTALAARRTEPLDDATDIVDPAPDPEHALAGKQRAALLRGAIHWLSPTHREIIDLVYDQGRSIAEIAELLHIPPNTVKTRMFYARQHLAALLRDGARAARPTTAIRACRAHRSMKTS
jgi:RNA polymerase sigma-70 factor (ECF subfamily)